MIASARTRIAAALVAAAAIASCSAPPADGPSINIVRTSVSTDPLSLSLVGNTDVVSNQIARLITESLLDYGPDMRLEGRAARSWEISADGHEVVFHLREGLRWHDGVPVTAQDVAFTVEKVRDPKTQSRAWGPPFRDLDAIVAVDDTTLRARFTTPAEGSLEAWRVPLLPRHLAGREPDLLTSAFASAPVGCGPYRFVRWERGREVELEANPDALDPKPRIRHLVFRILNNDNTIFEALVRGDIDLVSNVPPAMWRDAQASPRAGRLARFVSWRLSTWTAFWRGDGSNPFFADARVRRAMAMSLDRERFAATVLHGLGRPVATTYLAETGWQNPAVAPWPYDPEGARRLLDEAGWHAGPDGVRSRAGVPFTFTLLVPANNQELTDRIAAWMQQSFAAIGVTARIEKVEWQTFQKRRRSGDFQAATAALTFTPGPDQWEIYHSDARGNGYNYAGLADPTLDALLDAARGASGEAGRHAAFDAVQVRLHELEPITPIFQSAQPVLHDARLEGVRPFPLGVWEGFPGPRVWRWSGTDTER